jgi:hypothetical protein
MAYVRKKNDKKGINIHEKVQKLIYNNLMQYCILQPLSKCSQQLFVYIYIYIYFVSDAVYLY